MKWRAATECPLCPVRAAGLWGSQINDVWLIRKKVSVIPTLVSPLLISTAHSDYIDIHTNIRVMLYSIHSVIDLCDHPVRWSHFKFDLQIIRFRWSLGLFTGMVDLCLDLSDFFFFNNVTVFLSNRPIQIPPNYCCHIGQPFVSILWSRYCNAIA